MKDSLVVEKGMFVKFSLVPLATCLLHLQLLLQGSFHQEELKQLHCRDTQIPKVINFWGLLRHQITCHSAPFPIYMNSATTVARTSLTKTACLSTCWWSMEPAILKTSQELRKAVLRVVGCQGVKVFSLKDVTITTSVTTVIFITFTI